MQKVNDILLQELDTGKILMWQVVSIQLGSERQEGVVELRPLDRDKADVSEHGVIHSYIPAQILDATIDAGILRVIYRKEGQ